jgi:signal peptidase I
MRNRLGGPWRIAVAEDSMRPAIEPGDWLLTDPTIRAWPQRGSIVVVREPESNVLTLKRVFARPGDVVENVRVIDPDTNQEVDVSIRLGVDEAWLLGDNREPSIDSRRYGPVTLDRLVARAWFRYAPLRRFGRVGRRA